VTVARIGVDRTTNTPVIVLKEAIGDRVVSVWIGAPEANAIAMALQGVRPPRPITHDLLRHVLEGLGGELVRVAITAVRDSTYFAELLIRRDGNQLAAVDARPSDAIAIALRAAAPILVADNLLRSADHEEPEAGDSLESTTLRTYLERLDPQDFGRFRP
jgi:bifunctional DNase/RNase